MKYIIKTESGYLSSEKWDAQLHEATQFKTEKEASQKIDKINLSLSLYGRSFNGQIEKVNDGVI